MSTLRAIQMFFAPGAAWEALHQRPHSVFGCVVGHTALFALLPAIAGYYGTTQVGWQIGAGAVTTLAPDSAMRIAVLYYFAMIVAVFSVGWMVHWMGQTYGAEQPLGKCMVLASYAATPLFLVGLLQAYPVLWLNLLAGLPALAYTVFLFYTGVPVMMEVTRERGFLFGSAVLAFGLIALVAMLAVTVLLWGAGFAPTFVN